MNAKKRYKLKLWTLLGSMVLLGCPLQLSAGQWQIEVKKTAVVEGEYIQLQEIAKALDEGEMPMWKGMANSTLDSAPGRGNRKVYYRRQLKDMLSRHLGSNAALIRLPQKMVVQNGGKIFGKSEMKKRVQRLVESRTQDWDAEINLRDYRLPEYICLEDKQQSLEISFDSSLSPGRNTVSIKLLTDGDEVKKRFAGSVFLDLWKKVPCAASPIQRHETLDSGKIITERKNLAYLPYEIWDMEDKGGPWRLKKSIGEGSVLYKRILEPVPLICKGESVNLLFQGDSIRLEVPARALEEGSKGDALRVENLRSDKRIRARVRDKNTVVVR